MEDKNIAAKERWAAKRVGRAGSGVRSSDRLPPEKREVTNFPVLDMGIQLEVARPDWWLKIHGLVENPITLGWEEFMALEQFADTSDFQCVTPWSQHHMEWRARACGLRQTGASDYPQALRVEGCQVGQRNNFPRSRPPRPLESARLLEHGRSVD